LAVDYDRVKREGRLRIEGRIISQSVEGRFSAVSCIRSILATGVIVQIGC
jgi:hypothetical protein